MLEGHACSGGAAAGGCRHSHAPSQAAGMVEGLAMNPEGRSTQYKGQVLNLAHVLWYCMPDPHVFIGDGTVRYCKKPSAGTR